MPEAIGELSQPLLRYLSVPQRVDWQCGRYWLEEFAQDQVIFKVYREGCQEAYRGRRIPSQDAQSDSAPVLAAGQKEVDWRAVIEAWHNHVAAFCAVGELVWATEDSDLDAIVFETQDDADLGIRDESSTEWTADRLASQLLGPDVDSNWPQVRELIQLAEDTGFSHEQSKELAPRLLELAVRHRDGNDPQDKPAVWSAIRTGASMLRPNQAERLRPLLEPGHHVETSLVAVKMLGRIFEAQPPADVDRYPELTAEVRRIAESLLNRYAIASSQSAAMAQLAIYALAAMASRSTVGLAKTVRDLGQRWFTEQTARDLRELRQYWSDPIAEAAAEPRRLLDRAIRELGTE